MVTNASRFTQSGTVVGTVLYMSPEQAKDGLVGPETDVWAMGVVLFHCLSGNLPFEASNAASVLYKIVHEPAPELISKVEGIGPKLGSALNRALTKDVVRRYSNMRSFARAICLSAHSEGIELPAAPDSIGLPDWSEWLVDKISKTWETEE